ncbi:cytidine deaminase family protein [Mycolicibacterium sp.]|uniref:cytidine deaminase family protein n=1 Tax=Mycolicibacterium sp. TaxID=2320850 RepID=UPI0037C5D676
MENRELLDAAASLAVLFRPSEDCEAGGVAAALMTASSDLFTGICVDLACSIGFCAEHAAIAEMLKARQSVVKAIVAVNADGEVMPPCGRCRELLWQVDDRNKDAWVILGAEEGAALRDLLPRR